MKCLVIHPDDRSTDFLRPIYTNLQAEVVTGGVSQNDLQDMIREHDQVIMLGHGSPDGLLSVDQFPGARAHIIDDSCAPLLAEKSNSVFIWCLADIFVRRHKLRGFFTGMFISEVAEARMVGIPEELAQQHAVDESNMKFADIFSKAASCEPASLHSYVSRNYGRLAQVNQIANYNHQRLYANATS